MSALAWVPAAYVLIPAAAMAVMYARHRHEQRTTPVRPYRLDHELTKETS